MRITHIETGISAESRSSRSQKDNRKFAFRRLANKLVQHVLNKEKKDKVISNEVIRSYNVPDKRVKDHASDIRQSYSEEEQDIGPMKEARHAALAQRDRAPLS